MARPPADDDSPGADRCTDVKAGGIVVASALGSSAMGSPGVTQSTVDSGAQGRSGGGSDALLEDELDDGVGSDCVGDDGTDAFRDTGELVGVRRQATCTAPRS